MRTVPGHCATIRNFLTFWSISQSYLMRNEYIWFTKISAMYGWIYNVCRTIGMITKLLSDPLFMLTGINTQIHCRPIHQNNISERIRILKSAILHIQHPGQLVPKTPLAQHNSYQRQLVHRPTPTQDNSHPRQLVPLWAANANNVWAINELTCHNEQLLPSSVSKELFYLTDTICLSKISPLKGVSEVWYWILPFPWSKYPIPSRQILVHESVLKYAPCVKCQWA